MPLITAGESGHHDIRTDNVHFIMVDGSGERIRCAVTLPALEEFDPQLDRHGDGACIACFEAHRERIEQIASSKYDKRDDEPDGTILVKSRDVISGA